MRRFSQRVSAFTLIELLIVIAIIAILALIAVPNFLEAQTRAKVSRTYADMRSLGVAIEAYSVDFGRPPVSWWEGENYPALGTNVGGMNVYRVLTTPVAYIGRIPYDPFIERGRVTKDGAQSGGLNDPFDYRTVYPLPSDGPNSDRRKLQAEGYIWYMWSWGPSRSSARPEDNAANVGPEGTMVGARYYVYDPTNGTLSFGLIINTNKGIYSRKVRGLGV